MKTEALITMILAQGIVTAFTIYFFYIVLTIKPKPEPDSYADNNAEPREETPKT